MIARPVPHRRTRQRWLPLLAVLVALVAAPAAVAGPGWTAPTPLGTQTQFALAVDRDGKAIIIGTWLEWGVGTSLTSYVRPVSASSSWQPQVLDSRTCDWCASWAMPGVALDDHGDAVGTWAQGLTGPGNTEITVATRAAGGAWSPIALSPDENALFWNTDQSVAVGPNGNAVFVSNCLYCDDQGGALIAVRAVAPGAMAPRTYLSAVGEGPAAPVAGVDAAGRATVAWTSGLGLRVASRSQAGVWSAPLTLSAAESYVPSIAVAPSGAAEIAWVGGDGAVRSSRRAGPDAAWSAPVVVSPAAGAKDPSYWTNPPIVAIDSGDKAVLAWTGADGEVRAAVRPAGAPWTTTVIPSDGTSPRVAVNPAGTALVLFLGPTGAPLVSIRPSGGAWSTPAPLGAAGASQPRIATDGSGDAVAAWISATGTLQTSALDATGPVLSGLSVPGTAVAGQPVAVGVAPWDLWSAVASTAWDFGDGGTSPAQGTTHAYAQPGTYTVKVSAADAFGNVTEATRAITVSAPPVVTPPATPGPPGTVGTVGAVTVGLPGASAGAGPAPLSPAAAHRLPALRVGVSGTGGLRVGARAVMTLKLSRRVTGAVVRVQIRRGLRYTTVARGRVTGRRIPVALTFTSAGRFLVRVQISEAHRPTVNRLIRIAVRR